MLVACTFLFGHQPLTWYAFFQQINGNRRHGRLCKLVHFQLALILLITACPTSRTDSQEEMISVLMRGSQVDHTNRLYWIQDPVDGLCVGEAGMTECSDANLWGVHTSAKGGYSLELMSSTPLDSNWTTAKPAMCLDRRRCRRATSDVTVGPCDHCGAKDWDLEADGRVTQDKGRNCLVRVGERGLGFKHCNKQHTTFNYVEYRRFATAAGSHGASSGAPSQVPGKPMFKDPESGLNFPSDLSSILGDTERNRGLVVMGGSALRFFGMSIYTVGLYINAEDAAKSPELQRFRGIEAAELRKNETFYSAMMSKTDQYDRAIWIKLSIPIKGSLVKKNLEAEWNMDPVNKKILLDGSFRHAGSCCSRGTELLFWWTKEGTLEVRLDNQLVETFLSNDLAQDLFYNFVNDDPVSPHAKLAFVNRYPELLAKGASALEMPTEAAPSLRRKAPRYHSKEEPLHVKQHHWRRYLGTCMILLYAFVMVLSMPGSKRRFQERLRRGGGSARAVALRGLAGSWLGYMQRLGLPLGSLIYKMRP